MKRSVLLLLTVIAYVAAPTHAKDKNPADYPLIVHVLASSRETQLVYRGTDCTSSAYGEIDETDTLTARIYTTCSPNWAAHHYAFAEIDVTDAEPTVNNTVRFLGQCANVSGAARTGRILAGLGNAMAAAGGTPEQQAQAEQRSRRAQPIPPSSKCSLAPGDYAGRWQKGELELLLARSNGKYATVSFVVSVVTPRPESASTPSSSALLQNCPEGMTRVATSYGSYCKEQLTSSYPTHSSAPTEESPALTHIRFIDTGLQDCPQGMTRIPTSYGSYCGTQTQAAEEGRRAEEQHSKLSEPAVAAQSLPLRRGQIMVFHATRVEHPNTIVWFKDGHTTDTFKVWGYTNSTEFVLMCSELWTDGRSVPDVACMPMNAGQDYTVKVVPTAFGYPADQPPQPTYAWYMIEEEREK